MDVQDVAISLKKCSEEKKKIPELWNFKNVLTTENESSQTDATVAYGFQSGLNSIIEKVVMLYWVGLIPVYIFHFDKNCSWF